jgi:hypothetical protein
VADVDQTTGAIKLDAPVFVALPVIIRCQACI